MQEKVFKMNTKEQTLNDMLRSPVVSITGSGGCGKTILAKTLIRKIVKENPNTETYVLQCEGREEWDHLTKEISNLKISYSNRSEDPYRQIRNTLNKLKDESCKRMSKILDGADVSTLQECPIVIVIDDSNKLFEHLDKDLKTINEDPKTLTAVSLDEDLKTITAQSGQVNIKVIWISRFFSRFSLGRDLMRMTHFKAIGKTFSNAVDDSLFDPKIQKPLFDSESLKTGQFITLFSRDSDSGFIETFLELNNSNPNKETL